MKLKGKFEGKTYYLGTFEKSLVWCTDRKRAIEIEKSEHRERIMSDLMNKVNPDMEKEFNFINTLKWI